MAYLIVIAVAVIVLAVVAWQQGKRRQAILITVIPALTAALLVIYDQYRIESSRNLIALDRVALVSGSMEHSAGTTYRMSGRIQNRSGHRLVSFGLRISALDCPDTRKSGRCMVIGESNEDIDLTVPPGQARDFSSRIAFGTPDLKPRGVLIWDYEITYTSGS